MAYNSASSVHGGSSAFQRANDLPVRKMPYHIQVNSHKNKYTNKKLNFVVRKRKEALDPGF